MTLPRLLFALAAAALVAACGVKGPPELPGDKADMFPRTYPAGAVPHDIAPPGLYVPPRYPER
jgi:predicted small lipoprotein YifL